MTLNKKSILTAILFAIVCLPAMAFDGFLPGNKLYPAQQSIFKAVSDYWQLQETFYKYMTEPNDANEIAWNEAIHAQSASSINVGKQVLKSIKNKQYGEIELLSEIYKSLPQGAREALYPALGFLKVEITQDNYKYLSEEKFREYFPGYGYTEPGYKYRKGRELDREYKGVTWQSEEHSISTTWNVNLTISIDLLNILSGLVTSGVIKDLKVGPKYQMNVGGQPMIVCNVTFQRIKSVVTKTNRKFDINKVWFELLRAKSSIWTEGEWKVCGKTYEILQEPTGEAVVTGIEGAK
ncbi:MAG: hypothetical protein Kow0029_27380 [Candidatus Rifleibacteriota bacterium]